MRYRKIIFQLHKIVGLATGIVVFLVAITGCLWVFNEEIENVSLAYKPITPENKPVLPPSKVKEIAQAIFPDHLIHGAAYSKPDEAIEVIFYQAEPEFYQSVFLDPYSGELLHIKNHLSGFFPFVLRGHMYLWLPKEIGEHVVRISVLLFILIILSGFFLWIPKRKKNLKQRLRFQWKKNTGWKRKNFDLHTIIGFYSCFLALILAFTGSVIAYTWLSSAVYKTMGGDKIASFYIPENISKEKLPVQQENTIDLLFEELISQFSEFEELELHYPHSETESIYVEVSNSYGTFYDNDFRFFDHNTLKEIETSGIFGKYENADFADHIIRMNYDIHIGAIGGIAGKLIAFLASLMTASLPVTGVLLWYGRTYKKKRK